MMIFGDGCNWKYVKTLGDLVVRMGVVIIILIPLSIWKCYDIIVWLINQCR